MAVLVVVERHGPRLNDSAAKTELGLNHVPQNKKHDQSQEWQIYET